MTHVDVSKNCLSAHTHETTHGKSTIVLELLKWNKEDQNKKQITKKELHSLPLSEGLKPYNALQCPAAWAGWDPKAEIWWDSGRKRCASIWAPFRSVFLAPLCMGTQISRCRRTSQHPTQSECTQILMEPLGRRSLGNPAARLLCRWWGSWMQRPCFKGLT